MPTKLPLEQAGRFAALPMHVDVSLECGVLSVEQILHLEPGSVIRSLRQADDNVDIRISGEPIAYGEIVALEGVTSVRITRLRERS